MRKGDPVIYLAIPELYGEMEIWFVRKDGRLVCRIDPEGDGPAHYEVFSAFEVDYVKATA